VAVKSKLNLIPFIDYATQVRILEQNPESITTVRGNWLLKSRISGFEERESVEQRESEGEEREATEV